jgi:hypothetical protein
MLFHVVGIRVESPERTWVKNRCKGPFLVKSKMSIFEFLLAIAIHLWDPYRARNPLI